jgi:hypothetical protein
VRAPRERRTALASRPARRCGGEERVDLVDAVVERGESPAALGHQLDAKSVETEHLVDDPAEVADGAAFAERNGQILAI